MDLNRHCVPNTTRGGCRWSRFETELDDSKPPKCKESENRCVYNPDRTKPIRPASTGKMACGLRSTRTGRDKCNWENEAEVDDRDRAYCRPSQDSKKCEFTEDYRVDRDRLDLVIRVPRNPDGTQDITQEIVDEVYRLFEEIKSFNVCSTFSRVEEADMKFIQVKVDGLVVQDFHAIHLIRVFAHNPRNIGPIADALVMVVKDK